MSLIERDHKRPYLRHTNSICDDHKLVAILWTIVSQVVELLLMIRLAMYFAKSLPRLTSSLLFRESLRH